MTRTSRFLLALVTASMLAAGPGWAADIHRQPPGNFKKVSTLVKLPDFIPGLGTLYVDPATLPVGPFLGYDKQGNLVNVVYMIPMTDFQGYKAHENLGASLPPLKVNHVDVNYNPGHPGVEEPHYHITLWLIDKAEERKRMQQ
ncbi:hypothetical protein [Pelomicrobium sp. G1]|uniref:hypothetical protein n=1 Tax=unclassified Pelomicrobium TaxID=2815318 RepID=UPI00347A1C0A